MKADPSDPNIRQRYSSVAILLHWILALMLAVQFALGAAMPRDESGFAAYQLHKSIGIAILLLTLVRLAWRLFRRPPAPVEGGLGGFLAGAVHAGFYGVMILAPLSGWALVSTAAVEVPTVLFGVVPWPHLPLDPDIHRANEVAHEVIAWIGLGLFLLHVAGALRHHLILRDGLLGRMAPAGSTAWAQAVGLLVVTAGIVTWFVVRPPVRASESSRASSAMAEQKRAAPTRADAQTPEQEAPAEEAIGALEPSAESEPAVPKWTIQPGGRLAFSVGNGGESLHGSFADWSGSIRFDPDDTARADIAIDVDLASASVGDATMDGMLRGAEFLAADGNPGATWRATTVRRIGAGRYSAEGTLALKGARRPQPLSFTLAGEGPRRSVRGSATIDRTAFGIGSGPSAEALDQSVRIEFSFEAVREAQ